LDKVLFFSFSFFYGHIIKIPFSPFASRPTPLHWECNGSSSHSSSVYIT
jgi:hypothetical protein